MAIATKGTWWRLHRETVSGQNLRGIVNAGTRWILVGDTGIVPLIYTCDTTAQQDNLPTFTARTPNGSDFLQDVAYIATGVLASACGLNGRIETSTDQGQNWSSIALSGTPDLYGIIGVSGDATSRFITVGVDEIWGQDSGATWTQRWSGSQTWRSVAHRSGAGWVAVGDTGYASNSATGAAASWSTPYAFGIGNMLKVAANNSYFMAMSASGYAYRSATGASGSWTQVKNFGTVMTTVVPILTTGSWVAFSQGLDSWYTTDDGTTWTQNAEDLPNSALDAWNQGSTVMSCGLAGRVLVSYNQTQEDYVSPVTAPAPDAAFTANPDMTDDAVRRLIGQFRSST